MQKKKIQGDVHPEVFDAFEKLKASYPGAKNDMLAAAIWMFVGASPEMQAEALKFEMTRQVDRFYESVGKIAPETAGTTETPGTFKIGQPIGGRKYRKVAHTQPNRKPGDGNGTK